MEFAGVRFVQVPRHVGLDRVQAEGFGFFEPVALVFGHDSEIVNGSGKDTERFVVIQELVAGGGKQGGDSQ